MILNKVKMELSRQYVIFHKNRRNKFFHFKKLVQYESQKAEYDKYNAVHKIKD